MSDKQQEGFVEYKRFLEAVIHFQVWLKDNTPDTHTRDQAIMKITEARLWGAEAISKAIEE